ncbi:MAG: DUF1622 domain-containing protein [Solirubrobacterales bacterium]
MVISLEETVRDAVDHFIPVVEAIGATIIAVGVVVAAVVYLLSELRIRPVAYEHVRLLLGRSLALGIEFQLASDILSTAVSPTFDDIGMLAAIVAIRTVLNYFLAQEVERAQRMEEEGMLAMPGDLARPRASGEAPQ